MVEQLEYKFGFEKLNVWQTAIDLSKLIYTYTTEFPNTELYGLTSQIKRAVVSVSSNIAEGSCKSSAKEQAKFYEIAFGSLMEVLNQLILAQNFGYIKSESYYICRNKIEEVSRQLNALKSVQLRRIDNV